MCECETGFFRVFKLLAVQPLKKSHTYLYYKYRKKIYTDGKNHFQEIRCILGTERLFVIQVKKKPKNII